MYDINEVKNEVKINTQKTKKQTFFEILV